jgi:WD40 repeat protein
MLAVHGDSLLIATSEAILRLGNTNGISELIHTFSPAKITCMTSSRDVIAVATSDKKVTILVPNEQGTSYAISNVTTLQGRLPISLSILCNKSQGPSVLLYADKVGDVYATDLPNLKTSLFLGGHTASVITDLAVSPNEALVATCDRDEKIRLSGLPAFDIVDYCLGHTDVVTSIAFVSGTESLLLCSVSWDFSLMLWDCNSTLLLDQVEFDAASKKVSTVIKEVEDDNVDDADDGGDRVFIETDAGNFPLKVVICTDGAGGHFAVVSFKGEARLEVARISRTEGRWRFTHRTQISLPSPPYDILAQPSGTVFVLVSQPVCAIEIKLIANEQSLEYCDTSEDNKGLLEFRSFCLQKGYDFKQKSFLDDSGINGAGK